MFCRKKLMVKMFSFWMSPIHQWLYYKVFWKVRYQCMFRLWRNVPYWLKISFFFFKVPFSSLFFNFFFFSFILFLNFTILYWFCQILKWIHHRYTCVPHPEPSSLLPPHTIPHSTYLNSCLEAIPVDSQIMYYIYNIGNKISHFQWYIMKIPG